MSAQLLPRFTKARRTSPFTAPKFLPLNLLGESARPPLQHPSIRVLDKEIMFQESPQNLIEFHSTPTETSFRQDFRNLDRDYWAIIDEVDLEAIRDQIKRTEVTHAAPIEKTDENDAGQAAREVMINDIIRTLGIKKARNYIK